MKEEIDLRIEKYIGDLMSPEEVTLFEEEISQNPDLEKEIEISREISIFLKEKSSGEIILKNNEPQDDDVRRQIRRVGKSYFNNNTPPQASLKRTTYIVTGIAATFFIFFGVYFTTLPANSEDLYATYMTLSDLPSFTKRSDDITILADATNDFRLGAVDVAIDKLETYFGTSQDVDSLAYIYSGLLYAEKGQMQVAIEQLEILERSSSLDADHALWFQALVYLKFDERERARITLNEIVESPYNYNYKKAQDLLREI